MAQYFSPSVALLPVAVLSESKAKFGEVKRKANTKFRKSVAQYFTPSVAPLPVAGLSESNAKFGEVKGNANVYNPGSEPKA